MAAGRWTRRLASARTLRHELQVLQTLVDGLARSEEPRQVADALLEAARSVVSVGRGVVVGGPEGQLPVLAAVGTGELPHGPARAVTSAVIATAGSRGTAPELPAIELPALSVPALQVDALDPATDAWLARLLPEARNLLVVPLLAQERTVGAMVLELVEQRRWARGDIARLQRAADTSALVLARAWQLAQVQRLAVTDGLTKISNRRAFEATLEREIARAERHGDSVTLVLLDIDHFKRLNDTLGHQAGDDVLRNVAAALSCECRDFDTAARFGGEEFAAILPGCSVAEAYDAAERLRLAIGLAPSPTPVSASAGVATFPDNGLDPEALVRAADTALYASKGAGRDRSTLSGELAPTGALETSLRRNARKRSGLSTRVVADDLGVL